MELDREGAHEVAITASGGTLRKILITAKEVLAELPASVLPGTAYTQL